MRAFPFIAQLRAPLASSDDELARTAAWALCSLVRGPNDPASVAALLESGAGAICVEGAREALQNRRWGVLAEHLWSSAYLSASGPEASRALVALGHAPTLVAALALVAQQQQQQPAQGEDLQARSVHDATLAALRCAGNFCSCDDALVSLWRKLFWKKSYINIYDRPGRVAIGVQLCTALLCRRAWRLPQEVVQYRAAEGGGVVRSRPRRSAQHLTHSFVEGRLRMSVEDVVNTLKWWPRVE